jgi:hypothetical protein
LSRPTDSLLLPLTFPVRVGFLFLFPSLLPRWNYHWLTASAGPLEPRCVLFSPAFLLFPFSLSSLPASSPILTLFPPTLPSCRCCRVRFHFLFPPYLYPFPSSLVPTLFILLTGCEHLFPLGSVLMSPPSFAVSQFQPGLFALLPSLFLLSSFFTSDSARAVSSKREGEESGRALERREGIVGA